MTSSTRPPRCSCRRAAWWILCLVVAQLALAAPAPALDGSLDYGFGTAGYASIDVSRNGSNDYARDFEPHPAGGYIVQGVVQDAGAGHPEYVAKIRSNGELDATFGDGGVTYFDGDVVPYADVTVAPDGSIYTADVPWDDDTVSIARFTPAGVLDPTFGAGGIVTLNVPSPPGAWEWAETSSGSSVTIGADANGTVWAAGMLWGGMLSPYSVNFYSPWILKFDPATGTGDPAFGTGGFVLPQSPFPDGVLDTTIPAQGFVPDDAGGVYLRTGWLTDQSPDRRETLIAHYTPTGTLDPSFDGDGVMLVPDPSPGDPPSLDEDFDLAGLDASGRIVLVGEEWLPDYSYSWIARRVNPDGSLDPTFGTGGLARFSAVGVGIWSDVHHMDVADDDGILAAGVVYAESTSPEPTFAMSRLLPDGTPDVDFGAGGTVVSALNVSPWHNANYFTVSVDGYPAVIHDVFAGSTDRNVEIARFGDGDYDPPSPVTMSSSTHVTGGSATWSDQTRVTVSLGGGSDAGSGLAGFAVAWSTSSGLDPGSSVNTAGPVSSLVSPTLEDGRWWLHLRPVDAAGNAGPIQHLGPFLIDTTAPGRPDVGGRSVTGDGIWSARRHSLRWSGARDGLSGVQGYEVRRRVANGPRARLGGWKRWFRMTRRTGASISTRNGSAVCIRARAVDNAGNRGQWSRERCFHRILPATSLVARGWRKQRGARASSGRYLVARGGNASIRQPFTDKRVVQLVVTTCGRCGDVELRVDGRAIGRVSLKSNWTRYKQRFRAARSSRPRSGVLEIRPVPGTGPVPVEGIYLIP